MKKLIILSFAVLSLALPILSSCGSEKTGKAKALPTISGKAGEIGIISTKAQWDAEPGNALRGVLADEFPYIPQREPRYRLFNVPEENFNNIFKVHRNLLYVKIDDTCKTGMRVQRNVWAAPQTMLVITAPDPISAAEFVTANTANIREVFENAERDRVIKNAMEFENSSIGMMVSAAFGGSPYFPSSYSIKKQNNDFFWISYETSYTIQGVFIYRFPYEGNMQFTPKYLIEKRDEVMKENVPASREGSYMITNTTIVPGFEWKNYNGREFAEVRTLWDTHNDFMGGPFISDAFLSPDGQYVIVIEGFVYAPKFDKRDYLRQLEAIIYSWHWAEK